MTNTSRRGFFRTFIQAGPKAAVALVAGRALLNAPEPAPVEAEGDSWGSLIVSTVAAYPGTKKMLQYNDLVETHTVKVGDRVDIVTTRNGVEAHRVKDVR